jgi:hypothetical protein
MKGLGVFLSLMLALTGLVLVYLINISSTSSLVASWNILAVFGFLAGIARYKISNYSAEDESKLVLMVGIILLLNIIQLVIALQLPIPSMENVLSGGFVLTMLSFEESTWFFLYIFRKNVSEDAISL